VHYFAGPGAQTLLLSSTAGFGLLARVDDMSSRQRGGRNFLALEEGARPLPPVPVLPTHRRFAGLSLGGHLLVFALDELKLQANGGRGLTLMDVDAKDPLVSVATFDESLHVHGLGRGDKPKQVELRGSALGHHVGRRARKGRKVEGLKSGQRVLA
jgi:topoisomerase-4 subunit A